MPPDYVLIDGVLLFLLILVGLAAVAMRNLLAVTMMMSIYSLLMALIWVNMDSIDVAFTEASVGAGISTVLLIGTLAAVGSREKPGPAIHWGGLLTVAVTGGALIYGTLDMPKFGDPGAPVHSNPVSIGYLRQDVEKITPRHGHGDPGEHHGDYFHGHVPNFVTSVIVSYRGYDTMYETTVIFIAGMSMILLLRRRRKPGGPA